MLQLLKRKHLLLSLSANGPQESKEEITMDIAVHNRLTGKITTFFKVDPQLGSILRAAGLAEPCVRKEQPQPPASGFFVEESAHTGAIGIHWRKASGEVASTYSTEVTKEALESGWGVEVPAQVWAAFEAKRRARR